MSRQSAPSFRAFVKRGDFLLILCLLLAAGILYAAYTLYTRGSQGQGERFAEIYCDGELVKTVDLNRQPDGVFSLEQRPEVTFEVAEGKIRFTDAQCPDKLCANAGFLASVNQTAACLPYRVAVRISGSGSQSDVDMIAG